MLAPRKTKRRLLPGFEDKRELAVELVESPYVKGEYEPVVRNSRESTLTTMRRRDQIDDAQLRAGEWIRRTFEQMRMGSMAINPEFEPVDTSGIRDPIPDRILTAGQELSAAARELGKIGWPVVVLVCSDGLTVSAVARRFYRLNASRNEERYIGRLLRESLDVLAIWKGYATNKRK